MDRMTDNKQTNNVWSDRFYGENSFRQGERDTWGRRGEDRLFYIEWLEKDSEKKKLEQRIEIN